MSRKFKRFILNWIITTVQLSFVIGLLEALQGFQGVETLALLIRGLYVIAFIVTCLFGWRFYTGCYRDGDFFE